MNVTVNKTVVGKMVAVVCKLIWLLFQLYFNHQQDCPPPNESDPTCIQKETFHGIPFHEPIPGRKKPEAEADSPLAGGK